MKLLGRGSFGKVFLVESKKSSNIIIILIIYKKRITLCNENTEKKLNSKA